MHSVSVSGSVAEYAQFQEIDIKNYTSIFIDSRTRVQGLRLLQAKLTNYDLSQWSYGVVVPSLRHHSLSLYSCFVV